MRMGEKHAIYVEYIQLSTDIADKQSEVDEMKAKQRRLAEKLRKMSEAEGEGAE